MSGSASSPRRYRGVTPEERKARRRERLLDAGLDLYGTVGFHETSVREICQSAELNQRYFYESFEGREDLLEAVYMRIVEEVSQTALAATLLADGIGPKTRAGLTAWWALVTGDLRKARILCTEVIGACERLKDLQRETRNAFGSFIIAQGMVAAGAQDTSALYLDPVLVSRSLMGAVVELLIGHMRGELDTSVDELIDHCVHLFMSMGSVAVYGPQGPDPQDRASLAARSRTRTRHLAAPDVLAR